jgi:hypothetical protein
MQSGVLATLLVPDDDECLGKAEGVWSGSFVEFDAAHPELLPDTEETAATGELNDVLDLLAAAPADSWRLIRCQMKVPSGADSFRITVLNGIAGIWWNGRYIRSVNENGEKGIRGRSLPVSLPVEEAEEAELVIVTKPESGRLQTEGGEWYRRRKTNRVEFHAEENQWKINDNTTQYTVYNNRAARQHGWDTDARWLIVSSDGLVAALDVTRISGEVNCGAGFQPAKNAVKTQARCLHNNELGFGQQTVKPFESENLSHAEWDGRSWRVQSAKLPASLKNKPPAPMLCEEPAPGEYLFSGSPVHPLYGRVCLCGAGVPPAVNAWQARGPHHKYDPLNRYPGEAVAPEGSPGFRVCEALRTSDIAKLLEYMQDPDWRVQRASIERLGEIGNRDCCPALRNLLEKELSEDLYPHLPNEIPPVSLSDDIRAVGRDVGAKRFRLVQALIISLRKLGDRESLPLARAALENRNHFYPVYHACMNFLGELGEEEDIARLKFWATYPEVNTSEAAKNALKQMS